MLYLYQVVNKIKLLCLSVAKIVHSFVFSICFDLSGSEKAIFHIRKHNFT